MRDCYTAGSVMRASCISRASVALAACLACTFVQLQPGQVHAQASEQPPHYLVLGSAGVPLRLTLDDKFGQTRFAPAFVQIAFGYALPGGRLRHGFSASVAWNLTRDGGYIDPLYGGDQFVLTPSYLAYYTLNTDVIALGHVGLPIVVRGGRSVGLEIGAALAYRVSAGSGLFAELDVDAFGAGTFALLASLQLGVMIDYEVLP